MFSLPYSHRVVPAASLLVLLFASACTTPSTTETAATKPASPVPPLEAIDYSTAQDAVIALDREIANAGQDSAKLDPIAARLIKLLREPGTSTAARQAITERLSVFPASTLTAGENSALFTAMLTDPRQTNFARLALDRVPGESVDAIYLNALKSADPSTRLGIVQSIGSRRIGAAAPLLAPLLKNTDTSLVAATLQALSNIGSREALRVVSSAPNPNSAQVIEAALGIAHQLGGAESIQVFKSVSENPNVPPHLRAAAFHGLLLAEPNDAPIRFVAILSGDDHELKSVVIEAIALHPSKELVPALAGQLATWDAPTHAAVIAALGRRGDPAALSAVSTSTRHKDAAVRGAAITALGQLPGSADIALLLARIASGSNPEDAKLARQSLSRLNGPGVADIVIAQATSGDQPMRIIFLEQLALRNVASSVPLLLETRDDPVAAVRSAALGALADIAPLSEQRAILDWAVAATDVTEQSRALRALSSVTLRNPDVAERSLAITQAIENAPSKVAVRLLPVLPRISGSPSAESVARLALRDDAVLSAAAINTLARWPDRAGLSPLVDVAEKASSETAKAAATKGVADYLERNRDVPSADLLAVIDRLIPHCREPETKTRLVYLLGRTSGADALALAERLKATPELAAVATDVVAIIRANGEAKPSARASGNERQIGNIVDGSMATRWSVPARSDQWIEIDYRLTRPFRQIILDNNGANWGSPEAFAVFVTDDPNSPGDARATGSGQTGKTVIDLPQNTRGRYIIIRHTVNMEDAVWSISELLVD